jgi:hypothetical protein
MESTTKAVEIFVAVNCLVIGLSHLFQASGWVGFFKLLASHGKPGAFANGFIGLSFGSIIVSFHWIWTDTIPIIVTCLGIAQVSKSLIAFAVPQLTLRSMSSSSAQTGRSYQIVGLLFVVLSLAIFYSVFFG